MDLSYRNFFFQEKKEWKCSYLRSKKFQISSGLNFISFYYMDFFFNMWWIHRKSSMDLELPWLIIDWTSPMYLQNKVSYMFMGPVSFHVFCVLKNNIRMSKLIVQPPFLPIPFAYKILNYPWCKDIMYRKVIPLVELALATVTVSNLFDEKSHVHWL
jgi:hypothetical protein